MDAMTIRRGSLYAGVFLLAAGAVTLANAAGLLDHQLVADTLGALWPIAILAVGIALILRRTRAALPAGFAAAAVPGLALGGMVALGPSVPMGCADQGLANVPAQTREGSLGAMAAVELDLACGDLVVTTRPGDAWRLDSRDGTSRTTDVTADATRLAVSTDRGSRRWNVSVGPVGWTLELPTSPTLDLSTQVDAGRGRLALGGAHLGTVHLVVNAGDLRTDLAGATVDRLEIETNAGSTSIVLPADSFTGDIAANAGSVRLCTPADLGLRVRTSEALGSIKLDGLSRTGDAWETPGYAAAPNKADLSLDANVGSVTISSEGGCK
jgi:hypothetical protein